MIRNCVECKKPFEQSRKDQMLCSRLCGKAREKRRYRENNPVSTAVKEGLKFNTGTTGAMHELLACVDLMRKGFEVFRAVSPASKFDLAAFYEGKLFRVEVTTGSHTGAGGLVHPQKDYSRFDILIVVMQDGSLIYKSDLPLP